jgi:hypothetical protein
MTTVRAVEQFAALKASEQSERDIIMRLVGGKIARNAATRRKGVARVLIAHARQHFRSRDIFVRSHVMR